MRNREDTIIVNVSVNRFVLKKRHIYLDKSEEGMDGTTINFFWDILYK